MKTHQEYLELVRLGNLEFSRRIVPIPPINPEENGSKRFAFPGVYFVRWRRFIKIGSADNVEWRRRALESSIPEGDVVGVAWIPVVWPFRQHSPVEYEFKIHRRFAALRVRGEWFQDHQALREFIDKYGFEWPQVKSRG